MTGDPTVHRDGPGPGVRDFAAPYPSRAFGIDKVRADLARAAEDDMSRRVRCPVCQAMTRDIARHEVLHGAATTQEVPSQ